MKINEGNRYRRLNRTLFGDADDKVKTFAIISPENPLGWKNSTEEEFKNKFKLWTNNKKEYNDEALKKLKKQDLEKFFNKTGDETLKYGAFSYIQLKGSYGDKEKSFFIFNIPFIDAKKIARDYGQESFFFGMVKDGKMQVAYYQTYDACKTYQREEISNTITNEKDAEDFFSKYGLKFRVNLKLFGDNTIPLDNEWGFEEELKEPSTFKHRANKRREIKNSVDMKLQEYFNINEEIKVNDKLNPKLWDSNNELKEDVKDKLLDIVDNFLDDLKEDNINLSVVDVRLLGSNANYNYTQFSDIDLHIVADLKESGDLTTTQLLCNLYKSLFNSKYDIKLKGIEVEIYVEDVNSPAKSNGVYSLYIGWVKKPIKEEIPEIDYDEFERVFDEWENKYFDIVGEHSSPSNNELSENNSNTISDKLKNSKIRDKDGNLLICYHGSPVKNINEFNMVDEEGNPTTFFSASKDYANEYAQSRDDDGYGELYCVYLNITNPFDINDPKCKKEAEKILGHKIDNKTIVDTDELFKALRGKSEYDGIIAGEELPKNHLAKFGDIANTSYVPFYANQIIKVDK